MTSYELILEQLSKLQPSVSVDEREVLWLTTAEIVGLSLLPNGEIEIFLSGAPIMANSPTVRRALDFRTWHRTQGNSSVDASRLLLPSAGHFEQVAAFLCAELIRNGSDKDLPAAFAKVELIIELAIARLRLTDQAILGLAGEMLVLDALLRHVEDHRVAEIVKGWFGWRESTRDFSWSTIGVEVKTTTLDRSSHSIQGTHQIELSDHADAGNLEESLFLVSIGIDWLAEPTEFTRTLPSLVDSIVLRISTTGGASAIGAADSLLERIRSYGGESDLGYDHSTMSGSRTFLRPFSVKFARTYDMTDPDIQLLTTQDVRHHMHVDANSVRYRVELPNNVRGDINPVVGLNSGAAAILDADA